MGYVAGLALLAPLGDLLERRRLITLMLLAAALAAAVMIALALLLHRALPRAPAPEQVAYCSLLRSVLTLISEDAVLRQRMTLGFLHMAAFTVLWTPIAFLLTAAPYHYSETVIGLFGLIGVAGALTAPLIGRLADRGHGHLAVTVSLIAILASWGPLALGETSLIALIARIALLDAGLQGAQVNHQATVFALRPDARNRLNTVYMTAFFLGGVLGSFLAAIVYGPGGWTANCLLGATLATAAIAAWAATQRIARR